MASDIHREDTTSRITMIFIVSMKENAGVDNDHDTRGPGLPPVRITAGRPHLPGVRRRKPSRGQIGEMIVGQFFHNPPTQNIGVRP